MIKSINVGWAGHVARWGNRGGKYRYLMEKAEGNIPLGRPRRRRENNIKTDF
jgi:hypothetical protein